MGDSLYGRGVAVGLGIAFVIGFLTRYFLSARGDILAYFATVQPSLKPSPSPFERSIGCFFGLLAFLFFAVATAIFFYMFIYILSR